MNEAGPGKVAQWVLVAPTEGLGLVLTPRELCNVTVFCFHS